MEKKEYAAHIREDGTIQTIEEHLSGTAERAAGFAAAFGAAEAGRFIGEAHDIGKYSREFQRRIRGGPRCDHATAGALECARLGMDWAASAVIGHHSGLPDIGNIGDAPGDATYFGRLKKGLAGDIPPYRPGWPGVLPSPPSLPGWGQDALADSFLLRMLYSSLVDADYLDTERFMDPAQKRGGYDALPVLLDRLDAFITQWGEPQTELNQRRWAILSACRDSAVSPRGLYTLTVPTGGGKTVASLAFALRHAIENQMDRVIYVVPYTSIIEQNAQVFRDILGDRNVLEHHAGSLADMDENATPELRRKALAAENWDVPVVVTTAVRFFEAMYASRSSKCRRLHNLANSVLIFDEAQMLPAEHLKPCVAAIAQLVKNFRSTAVLCTATQPALDTSFKRYGLVPAELCPDAAATSSDAFRRVTFRFAQRLEVPALMSELASREQVLCIVNTRKMAKQIYDLLPEEGGFHLSTLMAPAHRRAVLAEIRARLREGKTCRVVSTSLVEAGVDIDFPAVYRQMAGLDSILQAAGRCNREGKRPAEDSFVTVFDGDSTPPLFQANVQAAQEALADGGDPAAPETIERYFHSLFDLRGEQSMDRCGVLEAFQNGIEGRAMPFRTVSESFHLIDNDTKTVYIPWREGTALTEQLLAGERSRALFRQAGQYSVSVYAQHFKALGCALTPLDSDSAVLNDVSLYSETTGLSLEADQGKGLFV